MKKTELKELYQMMFPEYPDIVTVRQLREMLGISRQLAYDLIADGEMLSAYEVFSLLGGTPLGIVPENDDINVCDNMYRTNKPFELLADNLVCGTKKMYDCVSTFRGIFGKLKRRLKRHK